jgi:hypothetical protein
MNLSDINDGNPWIKMDSGHISLESKVRPVSRAVNLAAIYEPII